MDKINVFILAAGRGERLQPITDHIPKPLLPVLGKPVVQRVFENISALPVNAIALNLYHGREAIKDWVLRCSVKDKITLFDEPAIFDTGGALKNAEGLLNESTFLVHNADILSDIDLKQLLDHHISSGNLVTLAAHDHRKFNCLIVTENGCLKDIDRNRAPRAHTCGLAFTGIAVYEPDFLRFLPEGASSVVDGWLNAVVAGQKIGVRDLTGIYWRDIGTPSSYAEAVFDLLKADGEVVYIHPSITKCRDIQIEGYVAIEEGSRPGNSKMKNCIVLPGYSAGEAHEMPVYENCIMGPDFIIKLDESEILSHDEEDGKLLIGSGGSDRKYYRMKKNDTSIVLMQCSADDPDYQRHTAYSRYFLGSAVPVPELIMDEPEKYQVIFEDAGDISLYSYLKCPRETGEIEDIYRRTLDVLVRIHAPSEHLADCTLLEERVFDREHFRWETEYFLTQFVDGIQNMSVENMPELESEFHHLAETADSFPKTVIHRDFQSQNVMVKSGMELRVIDFQGARMGPPAYDVVSILWDPYHRIDEELRRRLLEYYIDRMNVIHVGPPLRMRRVDGFDESQFKLSLISCRLQRHMQALGAYGFLSSVKGKKYFLKHVPEGVRLLKEDIVEAGSQYPALYELIMKL